MAEVGSVACCLDEGRNGGPGSRRTGNSRKWSNGEQTRQANLDGLGASGYGNGDGLVHPPGREDVGQNLPQGELDVGCRYVHYTGFHPNTYYIEDHLMKPRADTLTSYLYIIVISVQFSSVTIFYPRKSYNKVMTAALIRSSCVRTTQSLAGW